MTRTPWLRTAHEPTVSMQLRAAETMYAGLSVRFALLRRAGVARVHLLRVGPTLGMYARGRVRCSKARQTLA